MNSSISYLSDQNEWMVHMGNSRLTRILLIGMNWSLLHNGGDKEADKRLSPHPICYQCKVNPKKIFMCYLIALSEDSFCSIFLHSKNQTLSELFKLLLKTSGLISNLKIFWNIMSAKYRAFFIHTYTLNCESECYFDR